MSENMHPDNSRFLLRESDFSPAYLALIPSGELKRRASAATEMLACCELCPRLCRANRFGGRPGICRIGRYAVVSGSFPHHGEEKCLRGDHGSGTIFFSGCGLRCVFCQNFEISQGDEGVEVTPADLAERMLALQAAGCSNINLVTPSHVVPQILEALCLAAARGLSLPIVYNTSAYDSLSTLRLLDGIVDIYLPDFKIWDPRHAQKVLLSRDYPTVARAAIREMHRQTGDLLLNEHGIARRGLLVRHLVMPGGIAGTMEIMRFLTRNLSAETYVNLMAQYLPAARVGEGRFAEIDRRVTAEEFQDALAAARAAGLHRFAE